MRLGPRKSLTATALAVVGFVRVGEYFVGQLWETFVRPIIGLNVEQWAEDRKLDRVLADAAAPSWSGRFVTALAEMADAAYGLLTSGYTLAFVAGCVFIAFFDWLTWPCRALRRFRRSGGLFGPVRWDFRSFLGMVADGWTDLRIVGFQATGWNRRAQPLTGLGGCIRSDITSEEIPLQLNIGGDPVPPERSYPIPARAKFGVLCMLPQHPNKDGKMRGPPAGEFLRGFGGFTFVFRAEGREWSVHFPHEEVASMVSAFRTGHLERPEPPAPVRRPLN